MSDLPTYEEILQMLTVKAREGSVSAMIALERALRPGDARPEDIDEVIDRILAEKDYEDW
jgi:hypothetical protein